MYRNHSYTTACLLVSLCFAGVTHAESIVDTSEARNILVGNTVEGKIIKQDVDYTMYLHPSGKLIRTVSKDATEKGAWQITTTGELCISLDSMACHTIKKRGDDGYDLYSEQDVLELTIDKITLGNPGKMKP